MTDSLSVSFKYTREDILNIVVESLGFDIKKSWSMLISIVFLLIFGIYFLFTKLYILAIVFVIIAIMLVPVYLIIAYLNLASALKVLTDCVYTLEDNQLIAGSNLGFHYFNFKDIDRIVLTKPVVFIYVSKKNAYFIPVRAFSSEEKANQFITKLQYEIEIAKKEETEIENL